MAQRTTSLGPKPSKNICFCCFFVLSFWGGFVFWLFNTKKTLFPPRKGHFLFIFSVSLSFSLSLFWASLFFCFSFSVSLFSSFLSFFLLVFVFAFFWFVVFGSFFLSLSSLLFFHERNNIKILNCKFFFLKSFLFFWFPVFFLSSSFLLSLLFPDFKLCFSVQHKGFWFQNRQLKKNRNFWSKGRLQQNGFFLSTCVLQNVKSYRFFLGHFLAIFG